MYTTMRRSITSLHNFRHIHNKINIIHSRFYTHSWWEWTLGTLELIHWWSQERSWIFNIIINSNHITLNTYTPTRVPNTNKLHLLTLANYLMLADKHHIPKVKIHKTFRLEHIRKRIKPKIQKINTIPNFQILTLK